MITVLELDVVPYIDGSEDLASGQDVEWPVSKHDQHFGFQCSYNGCVENHEDEVTRHQYPVVQIGPGVGAPLLKKKISWWILVFQAKKKLTFSNQKFKNLMQLPCIFIVRFAMTSLIFYFNLILSYLNLQYGKK